MCFSCFLHYPGLDHQINTFFLSSSAYLSLHSFIYFGFIQIDRDIFTANYTWVQSVSRQHGSLFIHVQPRFRVTYDRPWPSYIEFESRLWGCVGRSKIKLEAISIIIVWYTILCFRRIGHGTNIMPQWTWSPIVQVLTCRIVSMPLLLILAVKWILAILAGPLLVTWINYSAWIFMTSNIIHEMKLLIHSHA